MFIGNKEVSVIGNWYGDWVTCEAWSCLCYYRQLNSTDHTPWFHRLWRKVNRKQTAMSWWVEFHFWYTLKVCHDMLFCNDFVLFLSCPGCVVNIIISLHLSITSFSLSIARISWSRKMQHWMDGRRSSVYRPLQCWANLKKGKQEADCNVMVGTVSLLVYYEGLSWYAVL